MSLDRGARLERLLARHRDAVVSEGGNNTFALHRKDQLLVSVHQADRAHQAADRWTAHREDLPELGASRLHLHPNAGVDVGELANQLRRHADGPIAVSPNHLLRGEPGYEGGPWNAPAPAPVQPRPVSAEPLARRPFAAVLDTGIVSHPWFEDTDWFAQVSSDQLDPLCEAPDYSLETQTGHGTFVAGVLLRQAPSAFLMIERVLDDTGICDDLQLLGGLTRLHRRLTSTGETLDVLNLSLGGYTLDDEPSPLLSDALARFGKHTIIVTAAGNNGSNRPFWPAALKGCVAVGALQPGAERRAEYSNHGYWVDACAVGSDVIGPFLDETSPGGEKFDGFARWSGTSFAAPHVAGAIAQWAAAKQSSASEAADNLLDPATRSRHHDSGVVVE
ncbi:MAG TPA: S8/S53 family peptidase [Actinocrinis sp.]|nr:S8/S53 family peptidase [Actinocrinis sp.]